MKSENIIEDDGTIIVDSWNHEIFGGKNDGGIRKGGLLNIKLVRAMSLLLSTDEKYDSRWHSHSRSFNQYDFCGIIARSTITRHVKELERTKIIKKIAISGIDDFRRSVGGRPGTSYHLKHSKLKIELDFEALPEIIGWNKDEFGVETPFLKPLE